MEQTLKELCAKHGLTGISATLFNDGGRDPLCVYVHWKGEKPNECCGAYANTFDEAFSRALTTMAERRTARAA